MVVFCCCTTPRLVPGFRPTTEDDSVWPAPPPPVRLPGPLTLNPVIHAPASHQTAPHSLLPTGRQIPASIVPLDPAHLGELVIEDSDSDESPNVGPHSRSASSTLHLVRTHLRRHISQDSISKRKSRTAVGSSQEEIERRAELKRLRRKRIQEELSSEDDNKAPRGEASSQRPKGPSLEILPHGGPRDTIEFSVTDDSRLEGDTQCVSSTDAHIKDSSPSSPTLEDTGGTILEARRASSPQILPKTTSQHFVRARHSLPHMTPDPLSRRASTLDGCSLVSWRLSYNAGQLDEFLGYPDGEENSRAANTAQPGGSSVDMLSATVPLSNLLSRSHSSPARQGTPENEDHPEIENDQSPLSTWLRSQGLRSGTPSFGRTGQSDDGDDLEGIIQEAEVVVLRRCSSVQNSAMRETDLPRPETHLYDMDIHNQLATSCLNTPDVSTLQSASGEASVEVQSKGRHALLDQSDLKGKSPENESRAAMVGGKPESLGIITNSSVYPSTMNSTAPTPDESFQAPDWMMGDNSASPFTLPGFNWLDNENNPFLANNTDTNSRRTTAKESSDAPATPANNVSNQNLPPRASLPPFAPYEKQRESSKAERIMGKFRLGHGAPAALGGRGRLHHGHSGLPSVPESEKPSLLARLHLTFPRKAKPPAKTIDGPGPNTQHRLALPRQPLPLFMDHQIRAYSSVSEHNYPSPYSPPRTCGLSDPDGGTPGLWQRAIPEEAKLRHSLVSGRGHHTRRSSLPDDDFRRRSQDSIPRLRRHRSSLASCGEAFEPISPTTPVEAVTGTKPYISPAPTLLDRLSVESPSITLRWEHGSGAVASPSSSTKEHRRQFSRIPDSWVRYYPRTLVEPNPSAVDSEEATPTTDASPRPWSEQDAGDQAIDSGIESLQETPNSVQRSISGRFGKAVVTGFSKLMHSKSSPIRSSPKSDKSRRKSFERQRCNLEYPELVLPPNEEGYMEGRVLGNEVHQRRGASRMNCPGALCGFSDEEDIALSPKMATLLHTDGAYEALVGPATPAQAPMHSKGSATTSTDRFVTPPSSLSTSNGSNASFHSHENPQPHHCATDPLSGEVALDDTATSRSQAGLSRSGTVVDSESGVSDSTIRPPKPGAWNGRAKACPFLTMGSLDPPEDIDWSYQSSIGKHLSLSDKKVAVTRTNSVVSARGA